MDAQHKAIRDWLRAGRESSHQRTQRLASDAKRNWVAFLQARKERK
jgi:hypothetical protein